MPIIVVHDVSEATCDEGIDGVKEHVAVSVFEDLLSQQGEQFDLRSELLASIAAYSNAPQASAGTQVWRGNVTVGAHAAWLQAPFSATTSSAA